MQLGCKTNYKKLHWMSPCVLSAYDVYISIRSECMENLNARTNKFMNIVIICSSNPTITTTNI